MKDNVVNLVLGHMAQDYQEQLPYYVEMINLARAQELCLNREEVDTEELLELIEKRQELINKLEESNKGISLSKVQVQEALGLTEFNLSAIKARLQGPGVVAFEKSIASLGQLLKEIKEQDQKNEGILKKRLGQVKTQLKNMQNNKQATKAYQPSGRSVGPAFLDINK